MRRDCEIIDGHLHGGYYIFVQAAGRLTDRELLRILGLSKAEPYPMCIDATQRMIYLTEDAGWIHIVDDVFYSGLWEPDRRVLDDLHRALPDASIFSCTMGDWDWSYAFSYYTEGELRRAFERIEHHDGNRPPEILWNIGAPLPNEKDRPDFDDDHEYLLSLARQAGVRIEHRIENFRCYAWPNEHVREHLATAKVGPCKFLHHYMESGYYIFVQAAGRLTDEQLLAVLGWQGAEPAEVCMDARRPRFYLTEDDGWLHIVDDPRYSLWFPGRKLVDDLHALVPDAKIFACMLNVKGNVYEFTYYEGGALRRDFYSNVVRGSEGPARVVRDSGPPLENELEWSQTKSVLHDDLLLLAMTLGIRIRHRRLTFRCYAKPLAEVR